jgi:hypothetical protein
MLKGPDISMWRRLTVLVDRRYRFKLTANRNNALT